MRLTVNKPGRGRERGRAGASAGDEPRMIAHFHCGAGERGGDHAGRAGSAGGETRAGGRYRSRRTEGALPCAWAVDIDGCADRTRMDRGVTSRQTRPTTETRSIRGKSDMRTLA